MPRRVVPIEKRPRRISAAPSSITWYGMIRCALPDSFSPSSETPRSSSPSISLHEGARVDHRPVADHAGVPG